MQLYVRESTVDATQCMFHTTIQVTILPLKKPLYLTGWGGCQVQQAQSTTAVRSPLNVPRACCSISCLPELGSGTPRAPKSAVGWGGCQA